MCKNCDCACKGEPGPRGQQGVAGPMGVPGTGSTPLINISATYTALAADYTINAINNTFVVTLPTAVGISGKIYVIKNSGTGIISLATTGGQLIDGLATQTLPIYVSYTVQSNNTGWIII